MMISSHTEISSNSSGKILLVDYLKGFSIFTIALMHLLNHMRGVPSVISTLSAVGGTGVHVFFLCSGIGLYTSYLKHQTSYVEFIKKRFLRVYLPYIVIILFAFFTPWLYYGDNKVTALLSHVFLFKMFIPQYEISYSESFWFVSTIFQLYALFIPMCWLKAKLNDNKLFALFFFGVSVAWWLLCYFLGIGSIRIWGSFCLQYIWEFALGFILAEAFYRKKKYVLNNWLLLALAILGLGLQAAFALLSDELKLFNDIPALVGYLSLALVFSNISFVKRLGYWLSSFSYEFYLIHNLVFIAVFHLLKPQGLLMSCAVGGGAMAIALGAAFGYHKIIGSISGRKRTSNG